MAEHTAEVGREMTPRQRALALVHPFEKEAECALPNFVDAVEAAISEAEERGAAREREEIAEMFVTGRHVGHEVCSLMFAKEILARSKE